MQYHDASGASVCLPFLQGAKLRIGQQVAFAVSQRGEAIDIEVIEVCGGQQENSNKNAGCEPFALEISDWIPSVLPIAKVSRELQTRRLQRSIGKFNNATPDERMEMLTQAEGLLENLLNEATLDGNAICRLVCRCVGWLHPENAQASLESKCVATDAVAGVSQPTNLQCRVRRLLILALSSLDLSDITTYQAVETAVAYIAQLMKACDDKASRARQWQRLGELIGNFGGGDCDCANQPGRSQDTPGRPKVGILFCQDPGDPGTFLEANHETKMLKRQITGEDRAGMLEGVYFPSKKVKGLDSVFSSAVLTKLCDWNAPCAMKVSVATGTGSIPKLRMSMCWFHPKVIQLATERLARDVTGGQMASRLCWRISSSWTFVRTIVGVWSVEIVEVARFVATRSRGTIVPFAKCDHESGRKVSSRKMAKPAMAAMGCGCDLSTFFEIMPRV